jgi:putative FmdB family regulatory protein
MPTYDYKCDKCEHTWELFQSIKANAVKTCPECKSRKARRVIGPGAGILFKGSGFYQTDYRSDAYNKDAAKDKPAKPDKKSDSTETSKKDKPSPNTPYQAWCDTLLTIHIHSDQDPLQRAWTAVSCSAHHFTGQTVAMPIH